LKRSNLNAHSRLQLFYLTPFAGYPKPKLSESELEASLQLPPSGTAGGKPEARVGGENDESHPKPLPVEGGGGGGGGGDKGFDRSGLKTSGRLRTGMLARAEVENVTLCIKQISSVCHFPI
jgi:hypothetical protein